MTIDIVHIHSGDAILVPITFILNKHFLVTNHSSDYAPFEMFTSKFQKEFKEWSRPELIFIGILDMIVEKRADNLEKIGINIEDVSRDIFTVKHHRNSEGKLHRILASIGKNNDIATKERDSLVTIERLLTFFSHQEVVKSFDVKKIMSDVHSLQRDVEFMAGHVSFLADKITFLLDATLGYINIEQNAIIKIFSVAAVIFLPPTLIASIYGMNFKYMPELGWFFGYPFVILLMILSASIPYYLFRRKGWL